MWPIFVVLYFKQIILLNMKRQVCLPPEIFGRLNVKCSGIFAMNDYKVYIYDSIIHMECLTQKAYLET